MTETAISTEGKAPGPLRALGEIIGVFGVYLIIGGLIALSFYLFQYGFTLESLQSVSQPGGEERMFRPAFIATPFLVAATLLAIYGFQKARGEGFKTLGLGRPESWKKTILVGLGLTVVVYGASVATQFIAQSLGLEHTVRDFMIIREDPLLFIFSMTAIAWFAAGLGEEIIFRGFLIRHLTILFGNRTFSLWLAVLGQAVVFALLHFNQGSGGVLAVFVIAMVFGISFVLLKRNLWPLIIAHAIYDNIGLAALYYIGP